MLNPIDGDAGDSVVTYQIYDVGAGTYYIHVLNMNGNDSGSSTYVIGSDVIFSDGGAVDTMPPDRPRVNKVDNNDKVITGIAEPYSFVGAFYHNKVATGAYADGSGRFTLKVNRPFKAGSVLDIVAQDSNENISAPTTVMVLDKTPPRLTVNPINSKSTAIKGLTEAGSSIKLMRGSDRCKRIC
ncbi:Ig-like domain-containing protein [Metabacillus sp. RGM 3146]|uniref:Ig-like domain-containing protein n=1 Tax=Metabacillus sp. RGM 3146 TaxID=3401092 RepID=UPI003B9B2CA5